jgi:hypothetical protein
MLFLIGYLLFTGGTYYSRAAKLPELTTTTLPNANFKADILNAGIDVQVGNWKNVTKYLLQPPQPPTLRSNIPLQEIFK